MLYAITLDECLNRFNYIDGAISNLTEHAGTGQVLFQASRTYLNAFKKSGLEF